MKDIAAQIGRIVASNRPGRGVPELYRPEYLLRALDLVVRAQRIAVITGFFVPSCSAPETDGPPGAAVLGRAISLSGRIAGIFTDSSCLRAMADCSASIGGPEVREAEDGDGVALFDPDLVIFIERLGRAADGRYYDMRGRDITANTRPLDDAAFLNVPVIGIGDGGNEAGMGGLVGHLRRLVPDYAECLSVVKGDVALPVDISNWGGYALSLMLSVFCRRWLGHCPDEESYMQKALVDAGAVDGVKCIAVQSVDGFSLEEHQLVVEKLHEIFRQNMESF